MKHLISYNESVSYSILQDKVNKTISTKKFQTYFPGFKYNITDHKLLFRGEKEDKGEFFILNPFKTSRASLGNLSFLFSLPSWSGIDKRTQSVVASTSYNYADEWGNGYNYLVIPTGNPTTYITSNPDFNLSGAFPYIEKNYNYKASDFMDHLRCLFSIIDPKHFSDLYTKEIGLRQNQDFYDRLLKYNRDITDIFTEIDYIIDELNGIDFTSIKYIDLVPNIDKNTAKLIRNIFENTEYRSSFKYIKNSTNYGYAADYFNYIFDPKRNDIQETLYSNLNNSFKENEVWFRDKTILIKI